MLSEGIYQAKPLSWGLGKTSKGTFQFSLRCRIDAMGRDRENPTAGFEPLVDADGNEAPVIRTCYFYVTDKTKDRTLAELKAIGYPHNGLQVEYLNPGNEKSHDFGKAEIVLECSHEQFNDRDVERWGLARQMKNALTREDQDQFNSLFGEVNQEDLAAALGKSEEKEPEKKLPPSKAKSKKS